MSNRCAYISQGIALWVNTFHCIRKTFQCSEGYLYFQKNGERCCSTLHCMQLQHVRISSLCICVGQHQEIRHLVLMTEIVLQLRNKLRSQVKRKIPPPKTSVFDWDSKQRYESNCCVILGCTNVLQGSCCRLFKYAVVTYRH